MVQACVNVSTGKVALTRLSLTLGDSRIYLLEHAAGTRDLTMINLHDDENSGVEAALNFIENKGGRLYELSHSGERNVSFELDGVAYEFDPNRMFINIFKSFPLRFPRMPSLIKIWYQI